jgi:hypothetical protein
LVFFNIGFQVEKFCVLDRVKNAVKLPPLATVEFLFIVKFCVKIIVLDIVPKVLSVQGTDNLLGRVVVFVQKPPG